MTTVMAMVTEIMMIVMALHPIKAQHQINVDTIIIHQPMTLRMMKPMTQKMVKVVAAQTVLRQKRSEERNL